MKASRVVVIGAMSACSAASVVAAAAPMPSSSIGRKFVRPTAAFRRTIPSMHPSRRRRFGSLSVAAGDCETRTSTGGIHGSDRCRSMLTSLRGGGLVDTFDDEGSGEEGDDDIDDLDGEEEEDAIDADDETSSTPTSSSPVKVIIQTNLNSPLVDQSLEFTASRIRTVANLKQSVSRTMRGRPPLPSVRLMLGARLLRDDEVVDDLAPDDDDDEDEGRGDDDDEEGVVKLRLTLDAVPPIDPKFGIELADAAGRMSTSDLVDAYAANAAAMHQQSEMMRRMQETDDDDDDDVVDDDAEEDETFDAGSASSESQTLTMRKDAAKFRVQMERSLSEEIRTLLKEEHQRLMKAQSGEERNGAYGGAAEDGSGDDEIYGLVSRKGNGSRSGRRRGRGKAVRGGATMNIKRVIQRNMNINWADTTRNFFLFLFFGYFGGRSTTSRTLMLLGAPMCFILQARPVKVALKQLFYTVGDPPGILLSLLPAPQQAIMSLDYGGAMKGLYGKEEDLGFEEVEGWGDEQGKSSGEWTDEENDDESFGIDSGEEDDGSEEEESDIENDYDDDY